MYHAYHLDKIQVRHAENLFRQAFCCSLTKQEGCSSEPFDCELQKDNFKMAWTSKKILGILFASFRVVEWRCRKETGGVNAYCGCYFSVRCIQVIGMFGSKFWLCHRQAAKTGTHDRTSLCVSKKPAAGRAARVASANNKGLFKKEQTKTKERILLWQAWHCLWSCCSGLWPTLWCFWWASLMQKGARSICFRFQQLFPTLLSFTSKSRKLVARFNGSKTSSTQSRATTTTYPNLLPRIAKDSFM